MMEQSKSISKMIAKFKIVYPHYFKDLKQKELAGLISTYQEELRGFDDLTIMNATKSIIRSREFMPTLKDIIEECEKAQKNKTNLIIDRMIKGGYFTSAREIEKVYGFVERNAIPHWLFEDMKKYGYSESKTLNNNEQKLLISN